MSDNIDYAELDKAVNEAIKNRSAGTAKPTAKAVSRPTPAPRPHGQYMDFVVRTSSSARTLHPAPVATKPVARVSHPPVATKPIARPVARPMATKITTAPRPAIVPRSAKVTAHPAPAPVRPSIATQIQQKQQAAAARPVAKAIPKVAAKPIAKTEAKPATKAKPTETQSAAPKPAVKPTAKPKADAKTSAPNANNYSLGVRSPFMTNTKVSKRPLGNDIPETSASGLQSTKNVYSSKSPSKAIRADKKHIISEAPKKHSGWIWTIVVLLVIAAGAGLGYLAYLLVFANQF